jgi:hypothetical protein
MHMYLHTLHSDAYVLTHTHTHIHTYTHEHETFYYLERLPLWQGNLA